MASGVIRRSLQLYMHHLNHPDIDPADEARAVRRCCSSLAPDKADQAAAFARLEALEGGPDMPAFPEVLHGPNSGAYWAAFDARVEETLKQLAREKTQHMRAAGRRMLWTSTSAVAITRSSTALASGRFRSSIRLRLSRLTFRNMPPMPGLRAGAMWRTASPSGGSTLMMSAPRAPS